MLEELDLELSDDYRTTRTCVGRDARRVLLSNVIKFCDNLFKIHCSGVELLAEIGDAQVGRCEEWLGDLLGLNLSGHKAWKTCGQHRVFDRYSATGQSGDVETCRAALLEECGTNVDGSGDTSFSGCCYAEALESDSGSCQMIDDHFTRGPCLDRSVCVNRLNGDWIRCAAPPSAEPEPSDSSPDPSRRPTTDEEPGGSV